MVAIGIPSGRCVRSAVPNPGERHPSVFDETQRLASQR
jgi:hypothetical protein